MENPNIAASFDKSYHRAVPHDVTAAILMFQINETAVMLVFQTNRVGVEIVGRSFQSLIASLIDIL